MAKSIIIINGPSLNLLGQRQPEIYGSDTLDDVVHNCTCLGKELGLEPDFFQSNDESEIIDLIHRAGDDAVGMIINPGAFTHTSVAILDALNAFDGPVFEVHVSNIYKRESFRHHSYVSLRADGVLAGFGIQGYEFAMRRLARILV